MFAVRPNRLIRSIYPRAWWRLQDSDNKIYLTFDDGPVPDVTENILGILKKYEAAATFFCVGANIEKNPALFRQILNEGHSVGNHTQRHLNGWKAKVADYKSSVDTCRNTFESNGWKPGSGRPLFRPPYGRMTRSQLRLVNREYQVVMWDVLTKDYDPKISPEKCLERSLKMTRPGSIVVFHDSLKAAKNVKFALPRYIETLKEKGFSFVKLEDE